MCTQDNALDGRPGCVCLHGSTSMGSPSLPRFVDRGFQGTFSLPALLNDTHSAEDVEDATLHYINMLSCDMTTYASWYDSLSLSSPKIGEASLIPSTSRVNPTPAECYSTVATFNTQNWTLDSAMVRPPPPVSPFQLQERSAMDKATLNIGSKVNFTPCATDLEKNVARYSECQQPVFNTPLKSALFHETRSIISYGIIGTLGRGTYGKVLLAYLKEEPHGSLFAIKVLRKRKRGAARCRKQELVCELTTLQLVSETSSTGGILTEDIGGVPFLQRLAESFQNDTFIFIVLEYHPTTLSDPEMASRFRLRIVEQTVGVSASISLPMAFLDRPSCSRSPASSCEETMASLRVLTAEISLGLLFLHGNGIVHQDIKPANIMISNTGHVVIGDFGAANRLPGLGSESSSATHLASSIDMQAIRYGPIILQPEDFVTFTPLYAAPELRQRNHNGLIIYDEKVDWWSLGVLLYELVTGAVPFNISCGTDTLRRGRRSFGDHSLAFGELEKLFIPGSGRNHRYMHLESFLRLLLAHEPNDRLSGRNVKLHPFFDSIHGLWAGITALEHPPCPNPTTPRLDEDISLDLDSQRSSLTVSRLSTQHLDFAAPELHIIWPTRGGNTSSGDTRKQYAKPEDNTISDFQEISSPSVGWRDDASPEWPQAQVKNDEDDSDDNQSIAQTLPSSASIRRCFNNTQFEELDEIQIFCKEDTVDSGSDMPVDLPKVGREYEEDEYLVGCQQMHPPVHSTGAFCSAARARSPSSSGPLPDPVPGCSLPRTVKRLDRYAIYSSKALPGNSVSLGYIKTFALEEKLTLSLLEAMDDRDRQSTVLHCHRERHGSQILRATPRPFVQATFNRIWRKLSLW